MGPFLITIRLWSILICKSNYKKSLKFGGFSNQTTTVSKNLVKSQHVYVKMTLNKKAILVMWCYNIFRPRRMCRPVDFKLWANSINILFPLFSILSSEMTNNDQKYITISESFLFCVNGFFSHTSRLLNSFPVDYDRQKLK